MKFEDLELWDTVKGFENYKVSSKGRVYSKIKNKMLKPSSDKDGYQVISLYKDKTKQQGKIHRLVCEAFYFMDSTHSNVDHKDNNPANNYLLNLRPCTNQQNQYNKGKLKTNKSGYKGVSWRSVSNSWMSSISVNGKCKTLGLYKTPEEAYERYKQECQKIHGEFYYKGL